MNEVDIVIGGAGVAGLAAAAAVQQLGYRVMLVEPGMNDDRRLAGEVFHPPGVSGLADLGLLPALKQAPAATVNGFCVSADGDYVRLPYDTVPSHHMPGLCLEHRLIRERMLDAVSMLPDVTVRSGSRVVGIDQTDASRLVVEVENGGARERHRCLMLIAADGTSSRIAQLAGIGVEYRRISTVIGYRISTENLPEAEFGHVFLGTLSPILLYPIGDGHARILFDVPYLSGRRPTKADCLAMAEVLPSPLRDEVTQVIATQPYTSALTHAVATVGSARGRVVLVGDAGGSCHPLTATGMTMCVSDALLLRRSLAEEAGDIPAALRRYQRHRRWPQATRLMLADALRDTLCGTSPELRMMRGGILAHWRDSANGRAATLALLSTADGRPLALLRQIVAVMMRGLAVHRKNPFPSDQAIGPLRAARSMFSILVKNVRQLLVAPKASLRERGGASANIVRQK